jgi:hypothetical protein
MGGSAKTEGGSAVNQTGPVAEATSDEAVLPERVQEAFGTLLGAAKEGLLALSVEVGLGVLFELLEEEVEGAVGPKGKWNPDRTAVRHGHENGEVDARWPARAGPPAAGPDRGRRFGGTAQDVRALRRP